MIELPYSLVIEAAADPVFFGQARWRMLEHAALLAERGSPAPPKNANPIVTLRNEQQAAVA